jgi:hypothetical protein
MIALAACRPPPPAPTVIENRTSVDAPPPRFGGTITEESLQAMMSKRFRRQLDAGTFVADYNGTTQDLLAELEAMGIRDLGHLARIIPDDYDRRAAQDFTEDDPANIPGVLRDIFIIHDARRYFEEAWQNHWQSLSASNVPVYRAYHVDLRVLVKAGVMSSDAIDASSP